jgi:hypothetical protein
MVGFFRQKRPYSRRKEILRGSALGVHDRAKISEATQKMTAFDEKKAP